MRLDKFLKLSRLIKRRTQAKEATTLQLIYVNGNIKKASYTLKLEDEIKLVLGFKTVIVKVISFNPKEEMFDLISEEKNEKI